MRRLAMALPLWIGWVPAQDLKIAPHPRIWLGKQGVCSAEEIRNRSAGGYADEWKAVKESDALLSRALVVLIDGDADKLKSIREELKTGASDAALLERAVAYDWVHARLSPEDRTALGKTLIDQAQSIQERYLKGGWSPYQSGTVFAPMALGLAALAVWDDDIRSKALFLWARPYLEKFFAITGDKAKPDDLPGRALAGGAWPEGFDMDRNASRPILMYLHGLRSAAGEDRITDSAYWKDKILYLIYGTLPDGKHLFGGDDNGSPLPNGQDRQTMLMLNSIFKDGHGQKWMTDCTKADPETAAFDLIFGDKNIPNKEFKDLPTARQFPGIGLVVMRSGWDAHSAFVTFRGGDWFSPHQHNAQNSVTLFRDAPLLIEPGVFDGQLNDYYVNWRLRTISHNSMLVRNPDEKFTGPRGGPVPGNDGGQMVQQGKNDPADLDDWRLQAESVPRNVANGFAFESTPEFDFAAADCARAYAGTKVSQFQRCVLYVKPNWLVIVDRVVADPKFPKTLVFHSPESIKLNEKQRTAQIDLKAPARMFVHSALPEKARLSVVGGAGGGLAEEGVGKLEIPEAKNDQIASSPRLEITVVEGDFTAVTAFYFPEKPASKCPEVKINRVTPKIVQVELEGKLIYDIHTSSKPRANPAKRAK